MLTHVALLLRATALLLNAVAEKEGTRIGVDQGQVADEIISSPRKT